MHEPILQVAAKAVITSPDGKVLIMREAATDTNNTKVGLYGLVGGRLNPGEAFLDGLAREILEETGFVVTIDKPLQIGEWRPVIQGVPHQIIAIFMLCYTKSMEVKASKEHDDFLWIDPQERTNYPIMEPDCFVIDMLSKQKTTGIQ